MRAQRDPAETDQNDHETCGREKQNAAAAAFDYRNQEKRDLAVEQGRSNGVAAGETVARPIDKPAVFNRSMSMHQNLYPFIQEHSAGHRDDHGQK